MTEPVPDTSRVFVRRLSAESIARGDSTGWFEAVYAAAQRGAVVVPWADRVPNHRIVAALAGFPVRGRAVVVGCGLGDDAEHVASLGYPTVAFDVAPTAIATARRRFPQSTVEYVTADLLSPPAAWVGAFDLVVEAYTLQMLTGLARHQAFAQTARLVAPDGRLLVIAGAPTVRDNPGEVPWPLTRAELESFQEHGLIMDSIVDFIDRENGHGIRRWRAWFMRPGV